MNPLWLQSIYRVVSEHSVDLILVRDLPMALAAIGVARICRIPVLLDMAENYPAMIRDAWTFEKFRLSNIVVRNPYFVGLIESASVRLVSGVLVVIEESRERLLVQYPVGSEKIWIVSNTPVNSRPSDSGTATDDINHPPTLKLIYIGGLEPSRTLDTVLKGMSLSNQVDCKLTILGKGESEQQLKQLALRLGLENKVQFEGFVPHTEIEAHLSSSDIGIIPHAATDHTNTTIPNKLFDYMASSKPVLAANLKPIERIITAEDCGLVYQHDSPQDFSSKLELLHDLHTRARLGHNGQKAVSEKYNWELDSRNLLLAIDKLT